MTSSKKNLRVCSNGHRYYKSSSCPVCPVCEKERNPGAGFLSIVAAPAKRALEREGIKTLKQLSKYSESEILALHGMGPGSIPKLQYALEAEGLTFKKK
jgi:hypothetical protein